MSAAEMLAPRSPLQAKLDGKSFVQLTVWFLVVLAAYALGKMLFSKGSEKLGALTGKTSETGSSNPFFG